MKTKITEAMKVAMKAQDKKRLGVIRLILSAIKQIEVDTRKELTEKDIIAVLRSMLKQRHESIRQYDDAGRQDLADQERFEVTVIEEYLPTMLDEAAVQTIVENVVKELCPKGMQDMGKVMAEVKLKANDLADMAIVSRLVKEKLQ